MIQCKKCGHNDYYVNEGIAWKGYVTKEGVLECKNVTNEIENIVCKNCGAEYGEHNFKEIHFI